VLRRALPSEDFTGSLIEFGGDHSQVLAGVDAEIGSFRKVLAEQAGGVLVDPLCQRLAGSQKYTGMSVCRVKSWCQG
jgi:hypothetical protein